MLWRQPMLISVSSQQDVADVIPQGIRVLLIATVSCLSASLTAQSSREAISAQDLAKKVVENQLVASEQDHTHWFYRDRIEKPSGEVDEEAVIETSHGDIDLLQSINGKPLTAAQRQKEKQRIQTFLHDGSRQKKAQKNQAEDAAKMERVMRVLPQALLFSYGPRKGDAIQLLFKPNPAFHPQSREARVLNALAGTMWVDANTNMIEEINGHLVREVRFGGGLLGHLDQGGQFQVSLGKVGSGQREMTTLNVHMKGKALFFSTISVQQSESRSGFKRVTDDLTLSQAAEVLAEPSRLAQIEKQK